MARGGKRPGAGRRPGTPNKATQKRQEEISESGVTPLEYMLGVMRDERAETQRRDDMAKAAAPYVHPKLAQTSLTGRDGGPVEVKITGDDASLL